MNLKQRRERESVTWSEGEKELLLALGTKVFFKKIKDILENLETHRNGY